MKNKLFILITYILFVPYFCNGEIIKTNSVIWKYRYDKPQEAVSAYFKFINKKDYVSSFFILDNSVQNLIRALPMTMDSSAFAKDGSYIFDEDQINALVGNSVMQWQSLIFLYDQLMASGIENNRIPFRFPAEFQIGGVTFYENRYYSVVKVDAESEMLQVFLRKDTYGKWRLLGISNLDKNFYWPKPIQKMWSGVTSVNGGRVRQGESGQP